MSGVGADFFILFSFPNVLIISWKKNQNNLKKGIIVHSDFSRTIMSLRPREAAEMCVCWTSETQEL